MKKLQYLLFFMCGIIFSLSAMNQFEICSDKNKQAGGDLGLVPEYSEQVQFPSGHNPQKCVRCLQEEEQKSSCFKKFCQGVCDIVNPKLVCVLIGNDDPIIVLPWDKVQEIYSFFQKILSDDPSYASQLFGMLHSAAKKFKFPFNSDKQDLRSLT